MDMKLKIFLNENTFLILFYKDDVAQLKRSYKNAIKYDLESFSFIFRVVDKDNDIKMG